MGIAMGTEVFPTKMKEILGGLDGCKAIMDGIIVFGRTEKEHDKRLNAILEKIGLSGLKLNKQIMPLDMEGSQVVCTLWMYQEYVQILRKFRQSPTFFHPLSLF